MSTKAVALRALLAPCALAALAALATACDDSDGPGPEPTVSPETEPGVSGFVFEDKNGNGVRDEGERGVEWDLLVCMSDMCRSGTTEGNGRFHFDDVTPGRYSINLANAVTGWQRVFKDCDVGTFTYSTGEHKTVDLPVRLVSKHASGHGGSVWKDGAPLPQGARVEALVGDRVCGQTNACGLGKSRYFLWVASAEEEEGCGEDGTEVRFRVDGDMANQTAEWHDGDSATVDLFAGPEPAVFEGPVSVYRPDMTYAMAPEGTPVQAYVAEQLCGESTIFTVHPGPNMYQIAVLPDALREGCGTENAPVTFTIGGETANEEAVWQPGVHNFALSLGEAPSPSPTPRP